jgi:hypothetical protein
MLRSAAGIAIHIFYGYGHGLGRPREPDEVPAAGSTGSFRPAEDGAPRRA